MHQYVHVGERERGRRGGEGEREREAEKAVSPGSVILTICEGLEAHLAAVFAKASYSPRPHLHHVDRTRPETLHTSSVGVAPQDGGINLCVVLKTAANTERRLKSFTERKNIIFAQFH